MSELSESHTSNCSAWQPIETLPKDEDVFLVWAEGIYQVAMWGKHNDGTPCIREVDDLWLLKPQLWARLPDKPNQTGQEPEGLPDPDC